MPVLEHSVSEFVEHFKAHASRVQVYPQTEASPLLEVKVGGKVVYLLDRVGPYVAGNGEALMIVNPMVQGVQPSKTQEASLQTVGISKLEGVGQVLAVVPNHIVLETTAKLVLGILDESWRGVQVGDWLEFSSLEPVHGFFVRRVT
jgi:hypothetical protein